MENLEIMLKLTVAETNIVLAGLGKLPLESGVAIWQSIRTQAESQIQSASVQLSDPETPAEPPIAA